MIAAPCSKQVLRMLRSLVYSVNVFDRENLRNVLFLTSTYHRDGIFVEDQPLSQKLGNFKCKRKYLHVRTFNAKLDYVT